MIKLPGGKAVRIAIVALLTVLIAGAAAACTRTSVKEAGKMPDQTVSGPKGPEDPFDKEAYPGQLTIRYLSTNGDIHTGDAIVIQSPDGKTMLIDAGVPEAGKQVVAGLDRLGIDTIDIAVNTHPHIDHIGGFASVLAAKTVKQFYMIHTNSSLWGSYYKDVIRLLAQRGVEFTYVEEGAGFRLGKDVSVEVLSPAKGVLPGAVQGPDLHVPVNMNSMVLKVTYRDQSFLFPADIYVERERELVKSAGDKLKSVMLHAAHHGLTTSSSPEFIDAVSPQFVVMSSNVYSNLKLASDLAKRGIAVYSTMENGTICIVSDGKKTRVVTEKRNGEPLAPQQQQQLQRPPVRLTFYYVGSGSSYEIFMDSHGKFIQRKYPNVSFRFLQNEKGTTPGDAAAAGADIDVFITTNSGMTLLKERKWDSDISDLVRKYNVDLDRFDSGALEAVRRMGEGKLTGLPFRVNSLALFYNKSLFDKFGVPYPQAGWSWDDTYAAAKRLTVQDGGTMYRGFGTRTLGSLMQLNPYSYNMIDTGSGLPKAAIANEPWKRYLNTFIPLFRLPGYNATPALMDGTAQNNLFVKDRTLAMLVSMNSDYPRSQFVPKFDWDVTPLPEFPDRPGVGSQPDVVYYALSATSKHRDEAFQAMMQMTSDEVQTELSKQGIPSVLKLPSIRAAFGSANADMKGKQAELLLPAAYAEPVAYTSYHPKVAAPLSKAFTDIVTGTKDADTALRDAENQANKDIASMTGANRR
ncbi:extracellular solute-binding protein [Paenibacillus mesophilus]|uniref:extracellular solute-binding protein n=1 Tax=Paenibacillus mesophilus TaxID=2582849 RepID=UPI00110D2F94|nr:extracellular solute-binding protein [Paenibacillus mesophilus]TMV47592.1 extracellular solute-binding protein [Paenibacillus mesophilus]